MAPASALSPALLLRCLLPVPSTVGSWAWRNSSLLMWAFNGFHPLNVHVSVGGLYAGSDAPPNVSVLIWETSGGSNELRVFLPTRLSIGDASELLSVLQRSLDFAASALGTVWTPRRRAVRIPASCHRLSVFDVCPSRFVGKNMHRSQDIQDFN